MKYLNNLNIMNIIYILIKQKELLIILIKQYYMNIH